MAGTKGLLICDQNGHVIQKAAVLTTVDGTADAGLTGIMTVAADGGGGTTVDFTCVGHGLVTNQFVTIAGTTDYNGVEQVTVIDVDTFTITDTWVDDQPGTFTLNANQSPVAVSTTEVKIVIPKYCAEVILYSDEDILIDSVTGVGAAQGFLLAGSNQIKLGVEPGSSLFLVRASADATVYIAYQNLMTA